MISSQIDSIGFQDHGYPVYGNTGNQRPSSVPGTIVVTHVIDGDIMFP
jgi:hypothetical protein